MLVELGVVEQRYRAVREVLEDGASVTDVARRHGGGAIATHCCSDVPPSRGGRCLAFEPGRSVTVCPRDPGREGLREARLEPSASRSQA